MLNLTRSALRAVDGELGSEWDSNTQGMCGAADLRGSNLKLTRLKVIGFGTLPERECFPVSIHAPAHLPAASNILVDQCVFASPTSYNNEGITVLTVAGQDTGQMRNAVVRRCTVTGMRGKFINSKAFTAAWVEDCHVEDCGIGVYFEPEIGFLQSVGTVLVRSNRFLNVDHGVYLFLHANTVFDTLLAWENDVVFAGRGARGWAFAACDTCEGGQPGTITNFVVLNNRVGYTNWTLRPTGLESGLHASNIRHAVFGQNTIALRNANPLRVRGYPSGVIPAPREYEDCDHPGTGIPGNSTVPPSLDVLPPGYRRAWFGNRDLEGNLHFVRQSRHAADYWATQQQWP